MSECPNSQQSPRPAGHDAGAKIPAGNSTQSVPPLSVGVKDAALIVGLSVRTLRTLINDGELPHARIGGRVLVIVDDLRAFLVKHRAGGVQ